MARLFILTVKCHKNRFRHFLLIYDVISCWRDVTLKSRHNSVKNAGIGLKFYLWHFNIKMNNRANFYKNRLSRSMFFLKRRIWGHVKNDDVITSSNMSAYILYCLHTYFTSIYLILPIFTAFGQCIRFLDSILYNIRVRYSWRNKHEQQRQQWEQ